MALQTPKKTEEELLRLRGEISKLEIARLKAFNDILERKWYLYREELYNTDPTDPYAQWIDSCMADAMNSIQSNIRLIICKENQMMACLQKKKRSREHVGYFQDLATCPQCKRLTSRFEKVAEEEGDLESVDSSTPLGC